MINQHTRRGQTQKEVAVKNKISHSVLDTESSTHFVTQLPRQAWKILNQVQDDLIMVLVKGFTLIELLVAIMIIGILAAVAVPQYQKAVMKSRFAAMMPIAKTLANANEVYYAEHDEYSTDPAKLNVTPQAGTPDGTAINMYSNPEEVSFVRVENPGVPNARYVVYQKLSENFPETTWCEAGDTRAEELCQTLGGTLPEGLTGNSSGDNTTYKAYLLTGQARSGDTFAETGTETEPEPENPTCPENSVCDEDGNVTGCATGYHSEGNACVETPPCPENAVCNGQGQVTGCSEGYIVNNNACEADPVYAQLQARAASLCPEGGTQYVCTIKNGAVYRCDKNKGKIDSATGECVSNGTNTGAYERIYDADGKEIGYYWCSYVDSGHCYQVDNKIPIGDGSYNTKRRRCADNAAISKEGVCPNGYSGNSDNADFTYDSHQNPTSQFFCSTSDISTTTGKCNKYWSMITDDITSYSTNGERSYVRKVCTTATNSNPEATCSGSYQPSKSVQYNAAGTVYKMVGCYDSGSLLTNPNSDGTCPSGFSMRSYDSTTGKYTTCGSSAASVNWETATCK